MQAQRSNFYRANADNKWSHNFEKRRGQRGHYWIITCYRSSNLLYIRARARTPRVLLLILSWQGFRYYAWALSKDILERISAKYITAWRINMRVALNDMKLEVGSLTRLLVLSLYGRNSLHFQLHCIEINHSFNAAI